MDEDELAARIDAVDDSDAQDLPLMVRIARAERQLAQLWARAREIPAGKFDAEITRKEADR